MNQLAADLRLAIRSLFRARAFACTAVVILTLGIALETCMIVVVNAYLVRELPYPESERLYQVTYARPGEPMVEGLERLDWGSTDDVIEHRIAWDLDMFYLVGGDYAEAAPGAWVTPGFMNGLGIRPGIGRGFVPRDYEPGSPQVALIGYALWQRRFGGDSRIVGRRFSAYVSDRPNDPELFTIIGVLPENFWHINPYTEVLTPLRAASYPYLVRLRAGVPPSFAARRITQLAVRAGIPLGATPAVELQSLHERLASRARPLLLAIAAAVSLVLLIACANVAFLVLIRGMRREKEVALRFALGAGRRHVARMLLLESLVFVSVAVLAGTALAWAITRRVAVSVGEVLGRAAPGGSSAVTMDLGVAAIVTAIAVVIAGSLALLPLLTTWRRSLFSALRRGRQSGHESARARRTRFSLITFEVAGSLTLLSACGLMIRTVTGMLDVDLGMQPAGVITASLAIRERSYPDADSRQRFYERLLGAVRSAPGLSAVAVSYPPPLAELQPQSVRAAGGSALAAAGIVSITPEYFAALSIGLVSGRRLNDLDRGGSEPVAVVSETAAQRLWPNTSPLGNRLVVEAQSDSPRDSALVARTVVGVVRDVRHSPNDEQTADVYLPLLQMPGRFGTIILQTSTDASAWRDRLRQTINAIDPQAAVRSVEPLQATLDMQTARSRILATTFAAFGVVATILALIGVYGVIAYSVKQREHEMAVRMAIGATPSQVVRLFLNDGVFILAAGLAFGWLGALGIGRLLEGQLFGVHPLDPAAITAAALILSTACLAAIWWPARRATATDPVVVLREE